MKRNIIVLMIGLMAICMNPLQVDALKLIVDSANIEKVDVIDSAIYLQATELAGNIGIGITECDCGDTYLGRGLKSLAVKPDMSIVTSDGQVLSRKAVMKGAELLYPLRAVCEYYGIGITWNEAEKTATVKIKEYLVISPQGNYSLVIDVRTPEEYGVGHIDGAVNIPLAELPTKLQSLEKYREEPILVYCKGGKRSAQAVDILLADGYAQIYHLFKGYDSLNGPQGTVSELSAE